MSDETIFINRELSWLDFNREEWMEGVASLIAWKRQLFAEPEKTADVKSRYSFEEF